ncbi:DUF3175 domain-containing protein [Trinickia diaoshuihuensis]|jgi:hypothetical protein|uniref:DUF3175 domain-containing protein n=1 Tax=Trinickia diaoshuihuensis TaxID=2292265 RepID=UPI000E2394DB|nr:DUF3175 domain-containing protein [Trinickia diaoshuihuensis]
MPSSSTHSSTRRRGAHPPRQRHAQSRAHHERARAHAGGGREPRRWSHEVMQKSDALDLEGGIFKSGNAEDIAQSLKRSSLASKRRRGTPYQSAMSMLNFYINRAGKNLPKSRRAVLEAAKGKLREAFGRPR